MAEPNPQLAQQARVSRTLGYGFVFTLVGVGGLGPLFAVAAGLWARHVVRRSRGELAGLRLAWWCILAGAVESAYYLAYWLEFAFKVSRTK